MKGPIAQQEDLYRLPYHWFPEERLRLFERQQKQRLVFGLIDRHAPKPIHSYLDVGCGDARWTTDIHRQICHDAREAVGIDFSERAIGFARLISPHIEFRVQSGEDIPYQAGTFDLVTAIEVIEHVEDSAEGTFLQELRRVLKPGGLLVVTTPSSNLPLTRHHFRHYSMERLIDLLEVNAFSVVEVRGQSTPCHGFNRWWRNRMSCFPVIWKLWRGTYLETTPEGALNLLVAARPAPEL